MALVFTASLKFLEIRFTNECCVGGRMVRHRGLVKLVVVSLLLVVTSFAQAATVELVVNWPAWAQENKVEFWNVTVDAADRDNDGNSTEIINSNLVTTRYGGENAICVPGFCNLPAVLDNSLSQTYTFNNVPPGDYRSFCMIRFLMVGMEMLQCLL